MRVAYISGPYRAKNEWELEANIRRAEAVALKYWKRGYAVFCPHKNTAHFGGACPDSVWLDGDIEILKRCDVIVMMRGAENSVGAMAELEIASACGLKIELDDGGFE